MDSTVQETFGPDYMYCLTCKQLTESLDVNQFMSKNNRPMKSGTCVACGRRKTKFTKGEVNTTLKKPKSSRINTDKDNKKSKRKLMTEAKGNSCYNGENYNLARQSRKQKIGFTSKDSTKNVLNEDICNDFILNTKKMDCVKDVNEKKLQYVKKHLKKVNGRNIKESQEEEKKNLKRYEQGFNCLVDQTQDNNDENDFKTSVKDNFIISNSNSSAESVSSATTPAIVSEEGDAENDSLVSCVENELQSLTKTVDSNSFSVNDAEEWRDAIENAMNEITLEAAPKKCRFSKKVISHKSRSYSRSPSKGRKRSKSKKTNPRKKTPSKSASRSVSPARSCSRGRASPKRNYASYRKSATNKRTISDSPYRCTRKPQTGYYTRQRYKNSKNSLNLHARYRSNLFRNNTFGSPLPSNYSEFYNVGNKEVEL